MRVIAISTENANVIACLGVVAQHCDKLAKIAEGWRAGERVSRKNSDDLGFIVEVAELIKVKWDSGRTSYYRRDRSANVRLLGKDRL